MEKPNFWNQNHPLSKQSSELFDNLVPNSGNCDTVVGELLRASNKITWDWFNNGWGCNNWSGAVIYIQEHISELNLAPEVLSKLARELSFAHDYSHGEPVRFGDARAEFAVTVIHEIIVQGILDKAPEDRTANTIDMYDLQEEDYRHEEEDEDEDEEDGYYD